LVLREATRDGIRLARKSTGVPTTGIECALCQDFNAIGPSVSASWRPEGSPKGTLGIPGALVSGRPGAAGRYLFPPLHANQGLRPDSRRRARVGQCCRANFSWPGAQRSPRFDRLSGDACRRTLHCCRRGSSFVQGARRSLRHGGHRARHHLDRPSESLAAKLLFRPPAPAGSNHARLGKE
jgi:hypothetical protein